MSKTDSDHAKAFTKLLKGKTIKSTRYLSQKECDDMGWYKRPLVIEFTDQTCIYAMADDEGNDGGAYAYFDYNTKKEDTIYVL